MHDGTVSEFACRACEAEPRCLLCARSLPEMWETELKAGTRDWYSGGAEYWKVCLPRASPRAICLNWMGRVCPLPNFAHTQPRGALSCQTQPATNDGVLGGYGYVTEVDLRDSEEFVFACMGEFPKKGAAALDCGAGIGRVSEATLPRHRETSRSVCTH